MSYRTAALLCLGSLLIGSVGLAADKQAVRVERIGDISPQDIILAPSLISADTCTVTSYTTLTMRIDGWVTGFELYKTLMNPATRCPNPYPYTVMAVNMPMGFSKATTLTVSVDVEAVDSTTIPGCPVPGVLLALSSDYTVSIPGSGYYDIWIPLDTPKAVTGPFFAGFYIGNAVDPAAQVALLTDENPIACASYNIWSDSIGWVDLVNNDVFNFPGTLGMEAAGNPGGNPSIVPDLQIVSPADGDLLYGSAELWAWDRALTGAVEYVVFEYSTGGVFTEIGRDFDGTSTNRNGVNTAAGGTGYNVTWDFSALPEGTYTIRATQVPTAGNPTSSSISVYLEPTPPIARVVSPAASTPLCLPVDIYMNCPDENMASVEVFRRQAASSVSVGVSPMNQNTVGDVNGNAADGNHVSSGEFGDYYSGPVAATVAAMVWSSRGYPALVRQGTTSLTVQQVAEGFATSFGTRTKTGTYDEAMLTGLRSYAVSKGGGFNFDFKRNPAYYDLRIWVEDESRVVMLGLGGTPGLWITVDGFAVWQRADSSYLVSVADPLTGTILDASWRNRNGYSELSIGGVWQRVEIMVSMFASAYPVNRTLIGVDINGNDGWNVHWSTIGIGDGTRHYLHTSAEDTDGHTGPYTTLVEHNCATAYVHGDFNGDRTTTMADLYLLIDFITGAGSAPSGGAARADCNCDNVVNIADVIYYMNYLYGQASPPCR